MNKTSFSLLFLLVFLTSCGNNVSPVDSGLENQIFHFGNGSEPQGLDPHIVTGVPEHHILIALCEGLTSSNPKAPRSSPDLSLTPILLDSTSLSPIMNIYGIFFNSASRIFLPVVSFLSSMCPRIS